MYHLPFRVLVHAGVRLHGVLFDEELDALVEGGGDGRGLLAEEHLDGVVAGQAHDVLGAVDVAAALAVGAICKAV